MLTKAGELIANFTPQHNKVRAAQCQAVKDAAEIAADIAMQAAVMSVNGGAFAETLKRLTIQTEATVQGLIDNKKPFFEIAAARQKAHFARQAANYVQWGVPQGRKIYKATTSYTQVSYLDRESGVKERLPPRLEFPMIKGHGFCGNVMGVIDDNSGAQGDELKKWILEFLKALQEILEDLFDSLFNKEKEDIGRVLMTSIMEDMDWTEDTSRVVLKIQKCAPRLNITPKSTS